MTPYPTEEKPMNENGVRVTVPAVTAIEEVQKRDNRISQLESELTKLREENARLREKLRQHEQAKDINDFEDFCDEE